MPSTEARRLPWHERPDHQPRTPTPYEDVFREHAMDDWEAVFGNPPGVLFPAHRHDMVRRFAWACPTPAALDMIARHGPVLEIGAGSGYWAWSLRNLGVDVVAFDDYSWSESNTTAWFPVWHGGTRWAVRYPERTLLLVWPPYKTDMAVRALRRYSGDTVVYVGEDEGGCNATDDFFAELAHRWTQIDGAPVAQHWGIHDRATTYTRS